MAAPTIRRLEITGFRWHPSYSKAAQQAAEARRKLASLKKSTDAADAANDVTLQEALWQASERWVAA